MMCQWYLIELNLSLRRMNSGWRGMVGLLLWPWILRSTLWLSMMAFKSFEKFSRYALPKILEEFFKEMKKQKEK